MTAAQDSRAQLRDRAIDLYTPPFRYEHGYIFDANGHMVADDCGENEGAATRVCGWGRIGYMENAAALQDEVGAIIAELLTAHWHASRAALSAEPVAVPQGWREIAESALKVLTYKGDYRSKDRFSHKLATISSLKAMLSASPQPAAQEPVAVATGVRTDYQPDGQATYSATVQALRPAELDVGELLYRTGHKL